MTRKLNSHEFHGITYLPCTSQYSRDAGQRWYRVTTHEPSGMMYSEEGSQRFRTLRDCREDAEYVSQQRSLVAND